MVSLTSAGTKAFIIYLTLHTVIFQDDKQVYIQWLSKNSTYTTKYWEHPKEEY